jgi:NTE family protein
VRDAGCHPLSSAERSRRALGVRYQLGPVRHSECMRNARMNVGLALSGGGARGAYQVGALLAISEILRNRRQLPFRILAGASAGAITSAFLAARADDFPLATRRLADFWSAIRPQDVFRTDTRTLAHVCAQWAADLSLGGLTDRHRDKALLRSEPLRDVLRERLDMEVIPENIRRGFLHGLALTATDYRTSFGVTFFDGVPEIAPWTRSTRFGIRQPLTIEHVMASSAIPIFFPAIRIGERYYADGCLRSVTPLSPAIHLGADRILAIAVRGSRTESTGTESRNGLDAYPSTADTAGLFLNAVFAEALETDVERLERVNKTVKLLQQSAGTQRGTPLREIPLFVLRPSRDLGALAQDALQRLPSLVQYLFRGLGVSGTSGCDLLSYLAFDSAYASKLLALGHSDAIAEADALAAFVTASTQDAVVANP